MSVEKFQDCFLAPGFLFDRSLAASDHFFQASMGGVIELDGFPGLELKEGGFHRDVIIDVEDSSQDVG